MMLDSHRQRDAQMRPVEREIRPPVGKTRVQRGHAAQDEHEAEQIAADLRGERRERGAGDAPAQHENRDGLEDDVERESGREQDRRRLAVAERAHEIRLRLIEDEEADARVDEADEGIRALEDLRRRLHPEEELPAKEDADCREHDACREREHGARRDAPPDALLVARAEALPRIDGKPRREADDKAEHEEHQWPRRANGRERIDAEKAPDEERVDERVELLENIARDERQSKKENQPRGFALREIFRHSRYLVTSVRSVSCSTVTLLSSASVCGRSFV